MPARFDSPRYALIAVVLAAVIFVCVNILSNLYLGGLRLDVTQGSAYTISKQIKPVFENIDEPITVRLYYSEALGAASPRHAVLYRRVRELLDQYAKLSKGKLKIVLENPEPFSDTEDRAVGFGLQAVPLSNGGEEVGYFGLAATNAVDEQQVIPFFSLEREQFIEYDLTKLIYSLSKPAQAKIGLITSLPLTGGMSGAGPGMPPQQTPPWAVMSQIKDFFEIEPLDGAVTEIPKDINVLLLVQPSNLTPATEYAIDQFALRGGKILAFVDPNPESAGPMGGDRNLTGIKQLMAAWGVNIEDNMVVGDLDAAIRVNASTGDRPVVSDYVAWLQLGPANLDRQDAVTGDIKQINLGTAGVLEKIADTKTTVTPLMMTGPKSMRIDAMKVQGAPDVVALFRDFQPSGKTETLAVRISGPGKTAFPNGPPDGKGADAGLKDSKQPLQIIIVADTDLLADRFWTEQNEFFGQKVAVPVADNASFVVNALENLTGSPALSSLRGRGTQSRPFVLIDSIRRDAEMRFRTKEKALEDRLEELQDKVKAIELHQGGDKASVQISDKDRASIDNYRSEILATRRDLREVQAALRRNIDQIEAVVKFINIAAVPLLFGVVMVMIATLRRRRAARGVKQS